MQLFIQDNLVIATYEDGVDTRIHTDGVWRGLPVGFRYTNPITDIEMTPEGEVETQRYTPQAGDPDPATNVVNIPNINLRKKYLAEQASRECQERIEHKEGETRYQTIKQNSFTDILMYCKDWLADNSGATEEEKAPYLERITKINSFRTWMRSVLNYYYIIQEQVVAADEAGLAAITWDYEQFEATDPGITLEEVRV